MAFVRSYVPGTGTLSFDDFCTLAARFMTEEEEDSEAIKTELREAFRLYDKEGSNARGEIAKGTQSRVAFALIFTAIYRCRRWKRFRFCSGNGYITTEVLREILSELDNNMSYEELDQMIDEIDADGSGTVDFDGNNILYYNAWLITTGL